MNALQLHYTSSRRGETGIAGFQVRSSTPGILPEDRRMIEAAGNYTMPTDVPDMPTDQQIDELFPRSLRSYTLPSGRLALTQSCYSGCDYSGRSGNFFAHTLVFDPSLQRLAMWPIDFADWPGWVRRLDPSDDTNDLPAPLDSVSLADQGSQTAYPAAALSAFLREPGRVDVLARMILGVIQSQKDHRKVVVRASHAEGRIWLACVQKALPAAHAWQLGTSTWQADGRNCPDLCATTVGSELRCSDTELRFQYYIFDFSENRFSDLTATPMARFADNVAQWLARDPERLQRLHAFFAESRHASVDDDLIHGLDLFLATEGILPSGPAEREGAVRFARTWMPEHARVRTAAAILQLGPAGPAQGRALADGLAFGLDVAPARSDVLGPMVHAAWLRIHRSCLHDGSLSPDEMTSLRQLVLRSASLAMGELAESTLDGFDAADVRAGFARLDAATRGWYFEDYLAALREIRGSVPQHPHFPVLVAAMPEARESPERLLRLCVGPEQEDPRDWVAVVETLLAAVAATQRPATDLGLGKTIASIARQVSRPLAAQVYQLLDQAEHADVLAGVCGAYLQGPDAAASWAHVEQEVLRAAPLFRDIAVARIIDSAPTIIPAAQREALACLWLRHGLVGPGDRTQLATCLNWAAPHLGVSEGHRPDDELEGIVVGLCGSADLSLPAPLWWRLMLRELETRPESGESHLRDFAGAIQRLEPELFQPVLDRFVQRVLVGLQLRVATGYVAALRRGAGRELAVAKALAEHAASKRELHSEAEHCLILATCVAVEARCCEAPDAAAVAEPVVQAMATANKDTLGRIAQRWAGETDARKAAAWKVMYDAARGRATPAVLRVLLRLFGRN